ncbi:hypothetical protein [Variovorax paradoxus]|uniref:hypothetical protein n=1 Tax=Variovorax paradoxus TaxID=34073 RepID=UPI003D662B46
MIKPAQLWLSIFLAGFVVLACLLIQSLVTPVPYGDLTRIGRISETEFGWRGAQPRVEFAQLRGVSVERADILVIGDSFSATHVWQSRLTQAGYGVATVFWDNLGERLCSDFDDWLRASGFRGKLVIIESVERIVSMRLAHTHACERTDRPLTALTAPRSLPQEHAPDFALNWNAQLISGWLTARCTGSAIAGRVGRNCDPQTVARPVKGGCERFTHRRCDTALFLAADRELGEITPTHAAQMQAFNQAHASVPILWMVVPNKWTTYLEPSHSHAFIQALVQNDLGPDLFGFAQHQKKAMRDFYYPNDTHISTLGQITLGERMLRAVQQRLGSDQPVPNGA